MVGLIYCPVGAQDMMHANRILGPALVLLFVTSLMFGFTNGMNEENPPVQLEEVVVMSAPTDPGHSVFAQYITSDNCGYCYAYGSPAHDQAKTSLPDRYVYISYHSANYGNTADAESGNIAPIYGVQHLGESGGAPKTSFGDATLNTGCGSNTCWDSYISSGGNMHSTATDYSILVSQSDNGDGTVDVSVSASYTGSGTAPSTITMYAAVTEKVCNSHVYADGTKGGNCWEAWLLNNGAYAHNGGNVGSGTGFETVNLNSGQATNTWTVPTSLVNGGASNMNTVAALYSTWSTTSFNADVFAAADSTMAPALDVAVTGVTVANPESSGNFMVGDTVTVDANIRNVGDLDYADGGTIEFFYKNGVNEVSIGSSNLNNLVSQATQTAQITYDTSSVPSGWKTTFGARITGMVGDGNGGNNVGMEEINQDRPPVSKKAQISGENTIERDTKATILAKADADDYVDTIQTMTFNIEVSPTGTNQWSSTAISGGQTIVFEGTASEGREYFVDPMLDSSMAAGWYDIRSQAVDSRGQTGDWKVTSGTDGFKLANGAPSVLVDAVGSVRCDTSERISMVGHIYDPETPLENLVITSDDEAFVAWHPNEKELEVKFRLTENNGCPTGQQSLEITMDDGGDYSETGIMPYGTLWFEVVENGDPRWSGVPAQTVIEGGSGLLDLTNYLSDTSDSGEVIENPPLTVVVMGNSNPEAIDIELIGTEIAFSTVDSDVNGQAIIHLRVSDGKKSSDTNLTINIQEVNDAPRLDSSEIESISIKRNFQRVIDLRSLVSDVDDPVEEAFVSVTSSEPGAARYSFIDGTLTLLFETTGEHTITVTASDKYASGITVLDVTVYDSLPFYLSKDNDGSSYMYIALEDTYISQIPTVSMALTDSAPAFNFIQATWNVCNSLTGTCDGIYIYELDMGKSSWTEVLNIPSLMTAGGDARPDGSQFSDYYMVTLLATDTNGDDYKTLVGVKWDITEDLPAPADMDDVFFSDYLEDLNAKKALILEQIESLEAGSDSTMLDTELEEVEADLAVACDDSRANCISETSSDSDVETLSSGIDMQLILAGVGIVIVLALLGLMVSRRGGKDANEPWNDSNVPFQDSVANSMYGGSQALFQQPVAVAPQPVAPQPAAPAQIYTGPPLPPGGLPAGWTMDQWAYYGQQYLDREN